MALIRCSQVLYHDHDDDHDDDLDHDDDHDDDHKKTILAILLEAGDP